MTASVFHKDINVVVSVLAVQKEVCEGGAQETGRRESSVLDIGKADCGKGDPGAIVLVC